VNPSQIDSALLRSEALFLQGSLDPIREKLNAIKQRLQANRSTTPLFAKDLKSAYTTMYTRYQDDIAPEHLWVEL
jgi:hypothetical protein